jgi:hypothetical protein
MTPVLSELVVMEAAKLTRIVVEPIGGPLHLVEVVAMLSGRCLFLRAFTHDVQFFAGQLDDPVQYGFEWRRHDDTT